MMMRVLEFFLGILSFTALPTKICGHNSFIIFPPDVVKEPPKRSNTHRRTGTTRARASIRNTSRGRSRGPGLCFLTESRKNQGRSTIRNLLGNITKSSINTHVGSETVLGQYVFLYDKSSSCPVLRLQ